MTQQTKGRASPKGEVKHTRVSGAKLFDLVAAYRRKGHTASFGADIDPKLKHQT